EGRRTKGLTPTGVTDNTLAFCDRIAAAGYTPAVYGDTSWFMFRTEFARLTKYTIWFHQYVTNPFFPYALGMWQYTKSGTVPGIGVAVDRNMAFRRADGSFLWAGQ
ncbi:MAG: hypothetical protein FWF49_05865, partial [Oscillospiraceae bacterium]|nr:hypothetical protein [Oscillospiraceae bacterium]